MSLLMAALLFARAAAAQTVSVPVLAPLPVPLGAPAAVPGTILAAPPALAAVTLRLEPALVPASAPEAVAVGRLALPAPASSPRLAVARGVARGVAPGAGAVREASVREGLESVARQIATAEKDGFGATVFSPALGSAFDGTAARLGAPSASEAPSDGAGPGPSARGPPLRELRSIRSLKLGTYNMLNLFEKVGDHVPDPERPGKLKRVSDRVAKEDWQLREQAKAILDSDLDVVVAQEIENVRALEDFNRRYLGGAYRVLLIEGNDERGIDIAFLVKKDLPFEVEHRTHQGETWRDPKLGNRERRLFSRDLPALIVRAQGEAKPLLVMLGTHFKSKRDRPGDRESETLRRAQVRRTAEIIGRYKAEFGDEVPLLLAGDFNGDLNREEAFEPLWAAGLANSLDLGEAPVAPRERVTHTYHPKDGPTHAAQMDGVLVSDGLKSLVRRSEIYRYRDARGKVKPIPRTYEERSKNPSDHFPLLVTLDFQPLVARVLGPAPQAEPADPLLAVRPVLEFQGEVIAAAARALGADFPLVSMLLAMLPDGPTLADWTALKERFEALGADRSEVWAAVEDAVGSAGLKGKLSAGRRPERGELDILPYALREADRQLVILRNNRYLSWQHAWQRGDARAARVSFEGASARLDGEELHLDLGALDLGGRREALRVTLSLGVGGGAAVEKFLAGLAASPSFGAEQRRQLAPLVARLKALGVVAAAFVL